MTIRIPEKKKSQLELIAERSGSHSRTDLPTWKERPSTTIRKRDPVCSGKPDNAEKLLLSIDSLLMAVNKELAHVLSAYVGSAKINELNRIKCEAGEMRCWDLSTPEQFQKCHAKLREFQKRLDRLGGLP
jgi:hypothetical protein